MSGGIVDSPFRDRLQRLCQSIEQVWSESGQGDRELIEKVVEDAVISPVADLTVRLLRAQRAAKHEGGDGD